MDCVCGCGLDEDAAATSVLPGRKAGQGLTAQVDLGVTRGFVNEFVRYQLGNEIGDWLGLRRDDVSAATIRAGWPTYIAFREGLLPVMPATFYLFDQFVRAIAMAFLNKGQSGTTTPITIPDTNRPV